MMTDERIRELCVRVVNAQGAAFDAATRELADALELWQNQDKDKNTASGTTSGLS